VLSFSLGDSNGLVCFKDFHHHKKKKSWQETFREGTGKKIYAKDQLEADSDGIV